MNDQPANHMDMIEEGLWLGGLTAAANTELLEHHRISHIVTVDIKPLPSTDNGKLETLFIKAHDVLSEDLIQHFSSANAFVLRGLQSGGVLIHCFHGVSRSATILAAFLIHKHKISSEQALERIRQSRPSIGPNPGFLSQLRLYEKIILSGSDFSCLPIRMFRLEKAAKHFAKYGILDYEKDFFTAESHGSFLRCKQCRFTVAGLNQLILHKPGQTADWRDSDWLDFVFKNENQSNYCKLNYFLEFQPWMEKCSNPQGKLNCPKCQCKLGSYNWTQGSKCPCGVLVCPAFSVPASRVDVIRAPIPETLPMKQI